MSVRYFASVPFDDGVQRGLVREQRLGDRLILEYFDGDGWVEDGGLMAIIVGQDLSGEPISEQDAKRLEDRLRAERGSKP
jgi:hypothetical protein